MVTRQVRFGGSIGKNAMLKLYRKRGEEIRIGDDITIKILKGRCRVGIDAPPNMVIYRPDSGPRKTKTPPVPPRSAAALIFGLLCWASVSGDSMNHGRDTVEDQQATVDPRDLLVSVPPPALGNQGADLQRTESLADAAKTDGESTARQESVSDGTPRHQMVSAGSIGRPGTVDLGTATVPNVRRRFREDRASSRRFAQIHRRNGVAIVDEVR